MDASARYSIHLYKLPESFLKEITTLEEKKGFVALFLVWVSLFILVYGMRFLLPVQYFWYAYVPAIFLIAGRFGALLQLIHEAAHGLLAKDRSLNRFLAYWLCGLPIGVNYDGYARGHVRHHAFTNMEKDPKSDTEKYRVVDFADPKLYLLFLKDILGITAISIFLSYDGDSEELDRVQGGKGGKLAKVRSLAQLVFVQLVVMGVLFQYNLFDYILLWIIPAVSPHMLLMRVRGIAEHGLAKQLGVTEFTDASVGMMHTRSFMTPKRQYGFAPLLWLEKSLIGSLSVYYHHEHHLMVSVPFYHLQKLHFAIADNVEQRMPHIYAHGYFAAAMRNLFLGVRMPESELSLKAPSAV